MKRIHIYKVKEKLFFVPTLSVGKIYSKMISPIVESMIGFCDVELGQTFNKTFELSVIGEAPSAGSGVFKELVELSKLKTHKNFIKSAKCMIVTFEEEIYSLSRVGGNEKHKAFMEDLGIDPVELKGSDANEEQIGKYIRLLFDQSETTTELIPIA